jgi:ABC-type spermidine/putrescine transport system permease subunit II
VDSEEALRSSLRGALGPLRPLLGISATLIGVFLLIPILVIFPMSVTGDLFLTWPPDLLSLRWFRAFFENPVWTDALVKSFQIAVPVALIATIVGTLAALGLAYTERRRRLLQTLFVAPLVLPIITYAVGLYEVSERFGLSGSVWPVIIGQTMLAAPLAFVVVSAGLSGRDHELPRAAASLGAPATAVLWRIELPLLRPSIVAAAVITLTYSFDEIVIAFFLLPPGGGTLPVHILSSTHESADPTIAAASMIVIGVAATLGGLVLLVRSVPARRRAV